MAGRERREDAAARQAPQRNHRARINTRASSRPGPNSSNAGPASREDTTNPRPAPNSSRSTMRSATSPANAQRRKSTTRPPGKALQRNTRRPFLSKERRPFALPRLGAARKTQRRRRGPCPVVARPARDRVTILPCHSGPRSRNTNCHLSPILHACVRERANTYQGHPCRAF